jgi:hypothetical protein
MRSANGRSSAQNRTRKATAHTAMVTDNSKATPTHDQRLRLRAGSDRGRRGRVLPGPGPRLRRSARMATARLCA